MVLKFRQRGVALLAAAALAGPLAAAPPAVHERPAPKAPINGYRLPNGLRVILSPDHTAPVVSLAVMYDVGSRNERPGRTGFAHLFEHLMFQGSENVGKGEHFSLLTENGGTFNGTTSQERTVYYETVPANQMELTLFLEADRMRALDVSQANLDNQREVVKEERRQRVENEAYGSLYEESLKTFFKTFAYQHSTIGSMDDLNAATVEDARQFFHTYYVPNNAVLVLAGDFREKAAKRGIEKYFGPIPAREGIPPVDGTEPNRAGGEQRLTLTDPLATLPRLRRYYRTAPGGTPDSYALTVLATVLSGRGKTGRLYDPLVRSHLALGASAVQLAMRTVSPFQIELGLPAGADIEKAEATLDAEIERVKAGGVTEDELKRARIQLRTSAVSHLQKTADKASFLATYALYYNDPDLINTIYSKQAAITAEDVQRVAKTYLTKENSATIIVLPARAAKSAAAGEETPKPEDAQ
ncbi:MAG TPA: pitrilysin family protein [Armatimonadota bacterium]|jgi:predicted Zn-dependent peptidase